MPSIAVLKKTQAELMKKQGVPTLVQLETRNKMERSDRDWI